MLAAVALTACGSSNSKAKTTASTSTGSETSTSTTSTGTDTGSTTNQATPCEKAQAPAPKPAQKLPKPTLKLDPKKTWVAQVLTNCGEFDITLDVKRAPKTSSSFASLVKQGFYNGLAFHRIVPGFVIQGGDPAGDGSGGPGYSVVEAPPKDLTYTRGVVAMAKTEVEDPGTSGSQFFVVTGEDAQLPPDYALLGKVSGGSDVVQTIGVAPTTQDEKPVDPIVIRQITLRSS